MMARISVGPSCAAASRPRGRAGPEVGSLGVLDDELEPPAVHDDLERPARRRGGSAGRRASRAAARGHASDRRLRGPRRRWLVPCLDGNSPPRTVPVARSVTRSRLIGAIGRPPRRGRRRASRSTPAPARRLVAPAEPASSRSGHGGSRRRDRRDRRRAAARAARSAPRPRPSAPRPSRSELARREARVAGHEPVEWQRGLDPADLGLVERPAQPVDGRGPVVGRPP